jgi:exodeoxyribonuclease VII small subunit
MDSDIEKMTYEEKDKRLNEILQRLDRSETPIDKIADDAREAAALIKSMNETLGKARKELTDVFAELERMRKDERA